MMDRFLKYLSTVEMDEKLYAAIVAGYKVIHYIPQFETIHASSKLTYKVASNLKKFTRRYEVSEFRIPELNAATSKFDAAYKLLGILVQSITMGYRSNLGPGDSLYEVMSNRAGKPVNDFAIRVSDHREVARNGVRAEVSDEGIKWTSVTNSAMQISIVVDSGLNAREFDTGVYGNRVEVMVDPMHCVNNKDNLERLLGTIATILTAKRKTPENIARIFSNELNEMVKVDFCTSK